MHAKLMKRGWMHADITVPASLLGMVILFPISLLLFIWSFNEVNEGPRTSTMIASVVLFCVACALGKNLKPPSLAVLFERLGNPVGMDKGSIVAVVGEPTGLTSRDGKLFLEWSAPGYRTSLVFFDGICEGVHHVSTGSPPIV